MNLPSPPLNHHYELEVISPLVTKVWLCRNEPSQLLEREIRTIWAFLKGKKNVRVHQPKNAKECYAKSICGIEDAHTLNPFSLFIPKVTKLFD